MATLRAAELARARTAERLRGLGAHALEVAKVGSKTSSTFGVVAYFPSKPKKAVPKTIEVTDQHRKHLVPIRVKIAEPFELEGRPE